jgi:hypothetical protein
MVRECRSDDARRGDADWLGSVDSIVPPVVADLEASESLMLATLRIPAILMGVGTGALAATLVALVTEVTLSLAIPGAQTGVGLVPGITVGLFVGGWVAGRMAIIAHRFHGAVTGLGLSALVVFIARLGGSPASMAPILGLFLLGIVVSGIAGWMSGDRNARRRARDSLEENQPNDFS